MAKDDNITKKIRDTFVLMDTPLQKYILYYILPSIITSTALILILPRVLSSVHLFLSVVLSILPFGSTILYPFVIKSRRSIQVESEFPMFVTQVTVLSYTNTNRIDIFRQISKNDNYDRIDDEVRELVSIVDTFNISIDDAARRRAKIVSSDLMSDFYEKLAYNLSSGNTLNDFLVSEQESVKQMYGARYEARLSNLESIGELFLSANMASAFLLVFGIISPLLTGFNAQTLVIGIFAIYVIVQISFLVLINSQSPKDQLWYIDRSDKPRSVLILEVSTVAGVLLFAVIMYMLIQFSFGEGMYVRFILSSLPLLVPGYIHYREEKHIQRVENQFSSFIRGLGNVESVKKTSTSDVLSNLKNKDFGEMKPYIVNLYRRLNLQISSVRGWSLFSSEIKSNMINRFSNMYVKGRNLGGSPKNIGNIVSQNYRHLTKLRKKRDSAVRNLIGYLYGMTVAWSATVFMTLQIIKVLVQITQSSNLSDSQATTNILSAATYNVPVIQDITYTAIFINVIIVSVMLRLSQRRKLSGVVGHIGALLILCFGSGFIIELAAERILDIN